MDSITKIIISHFDAHQRDGGKSKIGKNGHIDIVNTNNSVARRAYRIRKDIALYLKSKKKKNNNHDKEEIQPLNITNETTTDVSSICEKMQSLAIIDDVKDEMTRSILQCVDIAFTTIAQPNEEDYKESVYSILELASFICCEMKDGNCVDVLLKRADYCTKATDSTVRARACEFLEILLKSLKCNSTDLESNKKENDLHLMGSEMAQDLTQTELWRKQTVKRICQSLHPRLTDKIQNVRLKAVTAMKYVSVLEDNILSTLLRSMTYDPSFSVRKAAIESVPISSETIPTIIERIRDTKEKVRVTAIGVLGKKVNVLDMLTEDQRCTILRLGLTNRCNSTHDATLVMLCCSWMKSIKFDPISLLRLLDPSNNEKVCETFLREIITLVSNKNDSRLMKILSELSEPEFRELTENTLSKFDIRCHNSFDPSTFILLRMRCAVVFESKSMDSSEKSDKIEELILDVPNLCEALQVHLDQYIAFSKKSAEHTSERVDEDNELISMEDSESFICLQLLKLSKYAGLEEEGSRRHFTNTMHNMLCSLETPDDIIEGGCKAMALAFKSEAEFISSSSELVQTCKEHDSKDSNGQLRILTILSYFLEFIKSKVSECSSLQGFFEPILAAATSSDGLVREIGIKCLGKIALLSDTINVNDQIMPVLKAVCFNKEEKIEVRLTASMAICDLILLFYPEQSEENQDFFSFLLQLLEHDTSGVVAVASEICVKLLFAGTIQDEIYLAKLLIIFFSNKYDKSDVDDELEVTEVGNISRLQQLLSIFFPAYCMKSSQGRAIIICSIKIILNIIYDELAKKYVSKSTIPFNDIFGYVTTVVNVGEQHCLSYQEQNDKKVENDDDINKETKNSETVKTDLSMMIIVSGFILEKKIVPPTFLRMLCKILRKADVSNNPTQEQLRIFTKHIMDIESLLVDQSSLKSLEKLIDMLDFDNFSDEECDQTLDASFISKMENISMIEVNEN